jgi:hypothetical protein
MAASKRSPANQTRHDEEVKSITDDYKARGYVVQADVDNYTRPAAISGYVPDVWAKLEELEEVVEVETVDSINTDHAKRQDLAFRNWERQDYKYRRYLRSVV